MVLAVEGARGPPEGKKDEPFFDTFLKPAIIIENAIPET